MQLGSAKCERLVLIFKRTCFFLRVTLPPSSRLIESHLSFRKDLNISLKAALTVEPVQKTDEPIETSFGAGGEGQTRVGLRKKETQ